MSSCCGGVRASSWTRCRCWGGEGRGRAWGFALAGQARNSFLVEATQPLADRLGGEVKDGNHLVSTQTLSGEQDGLGSFADPGIGVIEQVVELLLLILRERMDTQHRNNLAHKISDWRTPGLTHDRKGRYAMCCGSFSAYWVGSDWFGSLDVCLPRDPCVEQPFSAFVRPKFDSGGEKKAV